MPLLPLQQDPAGRPWLNDSQASQHLVHGEVMQVPGLLWAFGGDSITNGSNASNFSYSYSPRSVQSIGGLSARPDFISGGKPGDQSFQLLLRMPRLIAAGAQAFVIMIGTNDAGWGVPVPTFAGNLTAIVNAAQNAGLPVVLCTIPPRGASTSTSVQNSVAAYNTWIRNNAQSLGVTLADVNSVLVDPSTGSLLASLDSGDGTHPNDTGHYLMSTVVAPAMLKASGAPAKRGLIMAGGTPSIQNLIQDPLAATAGKPSGWFEWPGGTGTAPVYSTVADTSGVLPAGQWAQMDFDATASGGTRRLSPNGLDSTKWNVGDTLLLTAHLQVEDVSGTWPTDVIAGNSAITLALINQSGVALTSALQRGIGRKDSQGYYDIGPVVWVYTIPPGTTALNVWYSLQLPTGKHVKMRVGAAGAVNLTQLGLAGMYAWNSTQNTVNT